MFKLNEAKMFYDISEGQAVVINFETGVYYGTTTLGSAVLSRLLEGHTVDAISSELKKLDGCPDDIEKSVGEYVDSLKEKEILTEGPDANNACTPFEASVASEGFDLSLDEFMEVQDLLLADPVHEVNELQGWPVMKDE